MNSVKEYVETVCQQVRWKKAHVVIQKELSDHIEDQREAFLAEGISQEKALQQAVAEMGDPVMVGTQLDRAYRPKLQWEMFVLPLVLLCFGIVIRLFVYQEVIEMNPYLSSPSFSELGILIFLCLAAIGVAYFLDFTIFATYAKQIYIVFLVILIVLSFFATIGIFSTYINGKPYFTVFDVCFAPELLLWFFPVIYGGVLYHLRGGGYRKVALALFAIVLPMLFMVLSGYGLTTAFVVTGICLLLFFMALAKDWFVVQKKWILLCFGMLLVLGICLLLSAGLFYRLRLERFFWSLTDVTGGDYQRAITRSIVSGTELFGYSTVDAAQFGFSEEAAARIGENPLRFLPLEGGNFMTFWLYLKGWLGLGIPLVLFFGFLIRGFVLAKKQKSQLGTMTAMAVLVTFFVQAIWYVIPNLGIWGTNPLFFPFLFSNGTNTVISCFLLGLLLSVFRTGSIVKDISVVKGGHLPFLEVCDGKIIIRYRKEKGK